MAIRVMIVDDTEHVREMLGTMLELDGFDVTAKAASGAEAIAKLDGAAPDVVVMDYKMPGMDGLTATRRLRELAPDVPVIVYTAYVDDTIEQAALAAGAALCIGKAEGLEELERRISEMCIDLIG